MVIIAINEYLYKIKLFKRELRNYLLTNNTLIDKKSIDLEKDFNEFLFFKRFEYFYKNCKIIDIVKIPSIIKLNNIKDLKLSISKLKINEGILITQDEKKVEYIDSALLKYIEIKNKQSIFEIYLFQQTLYKNPANRLTLTTLAMLKTKIEYLFYLKLEIVIQKVFLIMYLMKIILIILLLIIVLKIKLGIYYIMKKN